MVVDGHRNRRRPRHRYQQLQTTPEQELERLEERFQYDERALKDEFVDLWSWWQRESSVDRHQLQLDHQGERKALFRSHEVKRLARRDYYDREKQTLYRYHRGSVLERGLANARMKYRDERYRDNFAFEREKIELNNAQRTEFLEAMERHNQKETQLLLRLQQQVTDLGEDMFIERDRSEERRVGKECPV